MFFIVIFAIAIIVVVVSSKSGRKSFDEKVNHEKSAECFFIQNYGIIPTVIYRLEIFDSSLEIIKNVVYIVDEPKKTIFIIQDLQLISIPFSEILDCKIYEDSDVSGRFEGALVGGMLAGTTGAVVGASTAERKTSSYKISIIRSNISMPQTLVVLIDKKISTSNQHYKNAVAFAQAVFASIYVIIENNKKQSIRETPHIFCRYCGRKVNPTAKFCSFCGRSKNSF